MIAFKKLLKLNGRHLQRFSRCYTRTLQTSSVLLNSSSSEKNEQQLPKEADVVIIGGGSIGCNTLYHLAKKGVTNVVLLERDKLTSGTTWHTAGLVWSLRPSDIDIQLLEITHKLLRGLEEETGVNPGWINNGGLFIANNKERLDEYKRLHSVGKAFGIESFLLSPEESKQLYPLMNVSDVYGTLYSPQDGTVDPNGFCTALTRFAKRAGAKVIENCPVTDILTKENTFGTKMITGVKTSSGTIKTSCVVNCTGAWANYISEMVGIHTPLISMKHAYITTERIEGISGMPNIRDHDASVYLKVQGDALHIGGYENNPIFLDKVDPTLAFGLFELDWDIFGIHIAGACNRVPIVQTTGIKSTVCGPESFTPDHKPIMGEDPRVRGFFQGCGFNSAGMMFGGGCGKELAHWIVHGRPELDMYSFDVRRFCPEVSKDRRWIRERSHEAYAKNYSMVFPHDEPLAGRNMKKDPLHSELIQAGCVFQERHGWERPGWFTAKPPAEVLPYDWYGAYDNKEHKDHGYRDRLVMDHTFEHPINMENIRSECLSTRFHAALFDMSYFGKFYLMGDDAQKAVDFIFTNRMDGPRGKTIYTCMLNKKAGVEADLTVSLMEDEEDAAGVLSLGSKGRSFYIAAAGGAAYHNLAHIRQTIQDKGFKNVDIKNVTMDMGMLSVQGPKSRQILQKLTGDDLSDEGFPFSTHRVITVAGHKVRALRVSFVGEMGWELHVPKESCVPVYKALMEAGEPLGLVNAGYRAIDSLSIEKGFPHWHQELRSDDTPLEAGLMFTCKLNMDVNFLGRKALEDQKKIGAFKKKICLSIEHKDINLLGLEAIFRDGKPVGHVRRGDYAFYLDKPMAYGYVHDPSNQPITTDWLKSGQYELESMGRRIPAKLHLKSPFDPQNKRMQGDYSKEEEGAITIEKAFGDD